LCRIADEQANILRELAQKDESAMLAIGAPVPVDAGCADILPKMGIVIHIKRSVDAARADAIDSGGLTLVRIGDGGEPVRDSEINVRAQSSMRMPPICRCLKAFPTLLLKTTVT
jgi:hypothetical protein